MSESGSKEAPDASVVWKSPNQCPISLDGDSDGKVYAEECDGYGADNLMFWTTWSTSSQAAGKTQENLSTEQQYILKYSPIAK